MSFRRLITAETPEFRAMYGGELSAQIQAITASPEQQAAARELAARLEADKRRSEAQLLKEICDGADNGVYGKEGIAIAGRFSGEGGRSYYLQVGLKEALLRAGLLKRSAARRTR